MDTTIAAIATAPGEAGISVIRVSGPRSLNIADRIFRGAAGEPSTWPPNTFHHGLITSSAQSPDPVDEVVLLVYHAPHSYTGEQSVEIQGHGGRTCAARVLRAVLDAGAVPAGPGEFTRRAFLNGRLDLLQAEAVLDLIQARSDRAARSAMEQLEGHLSVLCNDIYDHLIHAAADLAATLDFPEDELPPAAMRTVTHTLETAIEQMRNLLRSWDAGRLLREGALVVIAGQPNAGKSTLLNRLLQMERAIVTATPGTTRDSIEESFILDGVPIRLVDTAGLRVTECHIEREGISRTRALMAKADITIYMIDSSIGLSDDDRQAIALLPPERSLVCFNKADLGDMPTHTAFPKHRVLSCSMLQDSDVTLLRRNLSDLLGLDHSETGHAAISERHRQHIQTALKMTRSSLDMLRSEHDDVVVLAASSLRSAIEALGLITGRVYTEDLLDNIFQRFCIGK